MASGRETGLKGDGKKRWCVAREREEGKGGGAGNVESDDRGMERGTVHERERVSEREREKVCVCERKRKRERELWS